MQIDWAHFSPLAALAGGAVIGLAAGLLILLVGRVAGVSGVVAGLLPPRTGDSGWRIAFALGLVAAPSVIGLVHAPTTPSFDADYALLAVEGLLVGFGSRLSGGCTSGHGVCGLSRLSLRSLMATAVFMGTAIVAVSILRHSGG